MIVIQHDVWLPRYIASIGYDEECSIHLFPLNCSEYVEYTFETKEEARSEYIYALTKWLKELSGGVSYSLEGKCQS